MTNRTYRVTEIVGTSPDGTDQAIRNGIKSAAETLRHIDWFEVTEVRGMADAGGSTTSRSASRLDSGSRTDTSVERRCTVGEARWSSRWPQAMMRSGENSWSQAARRSAGPRICEH